MHDFFAALISFFLMQPLQAHITEALAAARAPQAVVNEVTSCAADAAPRIIDRATNDPLWAASSAVRLWIGWTHPDALLVEAAPGCTAAVAAARPFFTEQAS